MLLQSVCNDDDRCDSCGGIVPNFQISSLDSVSMQTYGIGNHNPDTASIKDFYLLLHFSTEKMVFIPTNNFSCYATPPMPKPNLVCYSNSLKKSIIPA